MTKRYTKGPYKFVKVDYSSRNESSCGYRIEDGGRFDALWSVTENRPVAVSQDASCYKAYMDFPNEEDARLFEQVQPMYELLERLVAINNFSHDEDHSARFEYDRLAKDAEELLKKLSEPQT